MMEAATSRRETATSALLDAAERLLIETGHAALTTRSVAATRDRSPATTSRAIHCSSGSPNAAAAAGQKAQITTAGAKEIPYQLAASGRATGTDANIHIYRVTPAGKTNFVGGGGSCSTGPCGDGGGHNVWHRTDRPCEIR